MNPFEKTRDFTVLCAALVSTSEGSSYEIPDKGNAIEVRWERIVGHSEVVAPKFRSARRQPSLSWFVRAWGQQRTHAHRRNNR